MRLRMVRMDSNNASVVNVSVDDIWKIMSTVLTVVTGVAVANRRVTITCTEALGAGPVMWQVTSGQAQTASQTFRYTFVAGESGELVGSTTRIVGIGELLAPPGALVSVGIDGAQGGDFAQDVVMMIDTAAGGGGIVGA